MNLPSMNCYAAHEVRPEDIGLVTIKGDDETQPFMVAFLKATNHVKTRTTREVRRVKKSDYTSVMKNSGGLYYIFIIIILP